MLTFTNAHSGDDWRRRLLKGLHRKPESVAVLQLAVEIARRRDRLQRRSAPSQYIGDYKIVGWIDLKRSREIRFSVPRLVHQPAGYGAQHEIVSRRSGETTPSIREHECGFRPPRFQGLGVKQRERLTVPVPVEKARPGEFMTVAAERAGKGAGADIA